MVVVDFPDGTHCYMDGRLHRALERYKGYLQTKDRDLIIAVDGRERSGKSVLAQQVAKIMDPTFTHDRMCQTTDEFIQKAEPLKKGQAICFDEAYTGLSSRASRSTENRKLVDFFVKCGQKNLVIIIVLPTIRDLDAYPRDHRVTALLHVYEKDGKRGRWVFFDRHNLNLLLDYQKRFKYRYDFPRTSVYGRFSEQYVINEQTYRRKKATMLIHRAEVPGGTRASLHKAQRDHLLWLVYTRFHMSSIKLSKELAKSSLKLGASVILDAIKQHEKGNPP